MLLEPSDLFGFTGLSNGVDSHSDSYLCLNRLEVFIKSYKHAGIDRQS